MANVIQFPAKDSDSPVFKELLAETVGRIEAAADVLIDDAVNLAAHGPWREWSEEQAVGTVVNFDYSALAECNDPRLAKLYGLYCEMVELVEELRPAKGEGE